MKNELEPIKRALAKQSSGFSMLGIAFLGFFIIAMIAYFGTQNAVNGLGSVSLDRSADSLETINYVIKYGSIFCLLLAIIGSFYGSSGTSEIGIPIEIKDEEKIKTLFRETNKGLLKYEVINNEMLGSKVFLGDQSAPDGEYQYLEDRRKIIVVDGKVKVIFDNAGKQFGSLS